MKLRIIFFSIAWRRTVCLVIPVFPSLFFSLEGISFPWCLLFHSSFLFFSPSPSPFPFLSTLIEGRTPSIHPQTDTDKQQQQQLPTATTTATAEETINLHRGFCSYPSSPHIKPLKALSPQHCPIRTMNQQRDLMSQMQQQQQQQQQLQQHQHQLQQQQIHQQHLALQQQAPSILQQPRQPGGVRANSGNQIPYPLQTTSSPSSPSASGSQPSSPNGSMTSLQPPSPAKANTNTFVHKLHK